MSERRTQRQEADLDGPPEPSPVASAEVPVPTWLQSGERRDVRLQQAWREVEQLPDELFQTLERVLCRLAVPPRNLAGKALLAAGRLVRVRGASSLRVWLSALERALEDPALARETLELLVDAPVSSFRGDDGRGLLVLVEAARQLLPRGRRLASQFVQAVLPQLERVPVENVAAAASVVLELLRDAGPLAEFVCRGLIEAFPLALRKLEPEALRYWARTGACVRQYDWGRDWFRSPAQDFWRLRVRERTVLLRALWCSRTSSQVAHALYRDFPTALLRLSPVEREQVLALCERSLVAQPEGWIELAKTCAALLRSLTAQHRRRALELLQRVAESFPAAVPALFAGLPRLLECADWQRINSWVEFGLQLATRNEAAALAFFARESRTSVCVLQASTTAAELPQIRGWLLKYIHMLAATPLSVRVAPYATLLPAFEEQPLEGTVELPERIDWFSTFEDNVRVYRWLAVQLAGRWEYGTYAGSESGRPPWQEEIEQSPLHLGLARWFALAESLRVAWASARAYPAWAAEQESLARALSTVWREEAAARRVSWFDRLLVWTLSGELEDGSAPLAPDLARRLAWALAPLRSPHADVRASLAVARALAEAFARPAEDAPSAGPGDGETPPYLLVADLLDGDEAPPLPGAGQGPGRAEVATAAARNDGDQQWTAGEALPESAGTPLSPEALQALLESGTDLHLQQGRGFDVPSLGLYIRDLLDKLPLPQREELRKLLAEDGAGSQPRRFVEKPLKGCEFFYDEWDYQIQDYRRQWCRLVELPVEGDSGEFFVRTLEEYASLLPQVRREFQKVRPDQYRFVRGLEHGEEIDLNAVVEARTDLRARRTPSSKLYRARQREERDVAALFLLDMSASTDEPAEPSARSTPAASARRIIDIAKQALVLMAAALEEIGDAYAIYGFSGHGRHNVEFYLVKSFREGLSAAVQGRIGALEPKRSTRMGAAIRHAVEKLAAVPARSRHLILLSDGFPQDFDYGQDRRSNTYGLRDTTMALKECEAAGILPFCVTVDRAGHDYLREMCPSSRYLVIEDIPSLPRELPKIYQRVVGK